MYVKDFKLDKIMERYLLDNELLIYAALCAFAKGKYSSG